MALLNNALQNDAAVQQVAGSANTIHVSIILKVITHMTTQLYQNTHKALEIQYRHTTVLHLENNDCHGTSVTGIISVHPRKQVRHYLP
jgi:hypothetical protein